MLNIFCKKNRSCGCPEYDADGRLIINMNVKDDTNFLSVYSMTDSPVISSDVAAFIEGATEASDPNEKITLKIHSKEIDDEEKKIYDKAIRTYYKERAVAVSNELHRNNVISILLLFLGALVLTGAIILDYTVSSAIWSEIIDIIAWVLIWESADISLFNNSGLRIKKKRFSAFVDMKIEYFDK